MMVFRVELFRNLTFNPNCAADNKSVVKLVLQVSTLLPYCHLLSVPMVPDAQALGGLT